MPDSDVPTHWPGVIWLEQRSSIWDLVPSSSSSKLGKGFDGQHASAGLEVF